jgi:hypothetical protein
MKKEKGLNREVAKIPRVRGKAMGQKEIPIRYIGGVFDWCTPDEFEEGLRLWLLRHGDEIIQEIKKEKETQIIKQSEK